MKAQEYWQLLALSLGIFSTIILAFNLNRTIQALKLATEANNAMILALTNNTVLIIDGVDKHMKAANTWGKRMITLGFILLGLSFSISTFVLLKDSKSEPNKEIQPNNALNTSSP